MYDYTGFLRGHTVLYSIRFCTYVYQGICSLCRQHFRWKRMNHGRRRQLRRMPIRLTSNKRAHQCFIAMALFWALSFLFWALSLFTVLHVLNSKSAQNYHTNVIMELSDSAKDAGDKNGMVVLVITYNRPHYLRRTLESLSRIPDIQTGQYPVYVSQDGKHNGTEDVIKSFDRFIHMKHERSTRTIPSTAHLSQHYRWALTQLFDRYNHSNVIICEDDMEFSPDFMILFKDTLALLERDPTLWCISSWNDLGQSRYSHDTKRLFRTDFFPGLGWLLPRRIWDELRYTWPDDHWDHWMRLDTTSKSRDCIAPEVSRNRNFGHTGSTVSSNGQFFNRFIADNPLHMGNMRSFGDVKYLLSDAYEAIVQDMFNRATIIALVDEQQLEKELRKWKSSTTEASSMHDQMILVVSYSDQHYRRVVAPKFDLMDHPRASHRGTIVLPTKSNRWIILADRRESPYLPRHLQIQRDPWVQSLRASEGESCHDACLRQNATCESTHFHYLNKCSELKKLFPCEKGCWGGVTGFDVPNYVSNGQKATMHGYCLTTGDVPRCKAKHWSTSRICPCKVSPPQKSVD